MNKKTRSYLITSVMLAFGAIIVALAAIATMPTSVKAGSTSNSLIGFATVSSSCFFDASNTVAIFQTAGRDVSPGTTSDANIITFTDPTGNMDSQVLIEGPDTSVSNAGNWIGTIDGCAGCADTFYLANTLWGSTSGTATTHLTPSAVSTGIWVASSPSASANSIWLAVSIPAHQEADTYNAVTVMAGTC